MKEDLEDLQKNAVTKDSLTFLKSEIEGLKPKVSTWTLISQTKAQISWVMKHHLK